MEELAQMHRDRICHSYKSGRLQVVYFCPHRRICRDCGKCTSYNAKFHVSLAEKSLWGISTLDLAATNHLASSRAFTIWTAYAYISSWTNMSDSWTLVLSTARDGTKRPYRLTFVCYCWSGPIFGSAGEQISTWDLSHGALIRRQQSTSRVHCIVHFLSFTSYPVISATCNGFLCTN